MAKSLSALLLFVIVLTACTPVAPPTPEVVYVTQELIVTRVLETPTPAVVVVTATTAATESPVQQVPPAEARSHDWVDFGGICMRPDNIPTGISVSQNHDDLITARNQILESLWHVIEKSGSTSLMTPSFSNYSRFLQGVDAGVLIQGSIIPVGKTPPRSDPWSFFLEEAETVWRQSHPSGTFPGVDLSVLCFEFVPPFQFETEKRLQTNPAYLHLIGGVTHAIFAVDEVFDTPHMVIKLYQSPYAGKGSYEYLQGISPENGPKQNAKSANQHVGAIIASLNTVLWGNFDGDGVYELGYGPANSAPLHWKIFQRLRSLYLSNN